MASIWQRGIEYSPEEFVALYPEETAKWQHYNNLMKKNTQLQWDEMEESIKSLDKKRIFKAGIRLNSALQAFRLQNLHLFS